jgi:GTP-binding protein HflX
MTIESHVSGKKSISTGEGVEFGAPATRTLLVGPYLDHGGKREPSDCGIRREPKRSRDARVTEAKGLAESIDLEVVLTELVPLSRIRPSTYLGKGKVTELSGVIKDASIALVVMDCALSPVQQRNLERAFSAKVIDRTGLILEIFGRRARTREGALQVELAHLAYQKSRLVRSWTHLERQRGGFGFLGGPGESQIETDRRLIAERMSSIEHELGKVKRTRGLHRKSRRDVPYPIVALVGYTNAGKSTLFNRLTRANVVAADMLFATLDPTLRRVTLPLGSEIIVSDTVGFISSLPTMLVSAFRATLEEVLEADLILHVRDLAHADMDAQLADVESVLAELGIDPRDDPRVMEVWNKADLVDDDTLAWAHNRLRSKSVKERPIIVSALTGQGIDDLRSALEARLAAEKIRFDIALDPANGAGFSWLHANTEIMSKDTDADGTVHLTVRVTPERAETLRRRFFQTSANVRERDPCDGTC